jgi:hypothetical protein
MLKTVEILSSLLALTSLAVALPGPQYPGVVYKYPNPCEYTERADGTQVKEVFQHKQVTEDQHCGPAQECSSNQATSYSFGWEVSVGANTPFTSAGLSVSQSWTNEESHGCTGEKGDEVCLWYRIKYFEYELKATGCKGAKDKPHRKIKAPVTGEGRDTEYYCMTGKYCLGDGHTFWHDRKDVPNEERPTE